VTDTHQIGAFFDVDHTTIEVNSGRKYLEFLWKEGQISLPRAIKATWWLAQYRLSLLDYESMTEEVVKGYAGQEVAQVTRDIKAWFDAEIKPTVCRQAKERIAYHRREGHVIAFLTSGAFISVRPLQDLLDVEHLICTDLEIEEGVLTGRYFPPAAYGEGKLTKAEAFAAEHRIDLDKSYFYTDSYSDMPMLERVGEPRVVNPDPRLKRTASSRGWATEVWKA
jgi:HAD superfamily hydrolase (TIGR01490 family)